MSGEHRDETPERAEEALASEALRDGIGEDDNPIPRWFNFTFLASIAFALVYLLYYLFSGWSQVGQYEAERKQLAALAPPPAVQVAAANPFRGDAAALAAGKAHYDSICAVCHKADGSGLVGPSLVDPYWKYGSDDASLFASVSKGRPGGMPPWEAQLDADSRWQVLAYLETLPRSAAPGLGAPDYQAPNAAAPASSGAP